MTHLTDADCDRIADAILRAAGSGLRHYTMQKSRDDIRAAVRDTMGGEVQTDARGLILPRFIIAWPAAALWRNRKAHWAAEKRARDTQRREAWGAALAAGYTRHPHARQITVTLTFCPPSRTSRFDLDGALTACKGALDGLAQGLGVDDAIFVPVLRRGERSKNGGVIIDAVVR